MALDSTQQNTSFLRNKLHYWLQLAEPSGWTNGGTDVVPVGATAAAADDDGDDDAVIMKHYCHLYSRRSI